MQREAPKVALIETGLRLYERRILRSTEGNLSARFSDDRILTTRSGTHKGRLAAEDLVVTDLQGKTLDGGPPSSELALHLRLYHERPDVTAVVHAHPPFATGYAVARKPLPDTAIAELISVLGPVALVPYGTPSTEELADAVANPCRGSNVLLLANHGAVTIGPGLGVAEERMVQLEHCAQIALVAHLLGGAATLEPHQVAELRRLHRPGQT